MTHPSTTALLRWFEFEHYRNDDLRAVAEDFHRLAHSLALALPSDPETTAALRHLLAAKDSAVRATLVGLDEKEQERLATAPEE